MTLIIKTAVPSSCQQANEAVSCDYWTEDPTLGIGPATGSSSAGLCDKTTTVKADFVLPAEGDVIVPIAL